MRAVEKYYSGLRIAITLTLCTVGCGPAVTSAPFLSPPPDPKPTENPVHFYAESRPQCPYEEIGTVSARKRSGSRDGVMAAIRKRVREMGGDAVIGVTQGQQLRGGVVTGNIVSVGSRPTVAGTVIRFRDPACAR